jgi:hypothetical protein
MMRAHSIRFSIAADAAWAPGIDTPAAWAAWAEAPFPIVGASEPAVRDMPPILRRRAGTLGKMALEVAYQCLAGRSNVPAVFCSRHGEVARAIELLTALAHDEALSPTGFGLAVHNASAGLFSIARADHANHMALAAGASSIEHAVIEACSLLADGAPEVLLVAYDNRLPPLFAPFADCAEQPYAWAWLMVPAAADAIALSWQASDAPEPGDVDAAPAGLDILRFHLRRDAQLMRRADRRQWHWQRDAATA